MLFLLLSPIRGNTTKTSRTSARIATVPTQTRPLYRSTCQLMPWKTLKPTAAVCVAVHTHQWVSRIHAFLCKRKCTIQTVHEMSKLPNVVSSDTLHIIIESVVESIDSCISKQPVRSVFRLKHTGGMFLISFFKYVGVIRSENKPN